MTEIEYIRVGNLKTIIAAEAVMGNLLPGDEYGIPEDELQQIAIRLDKWRNALFEIIEDTVSEDQPT